MFIKINKAFDIMYKSFYGKHILVLILITVIAYPSPKMAFSVIPIRAVAHAQTNINRPKNTWTSRYEALI